MGALRLLFVSEISAQSTGRIGLEADTWPESCVGSSHCCL
jgi:hypothetical protein